MYGSPRRGQIWPILGGGGPPPPGGSNFNNFFKKKSEKSEKTVLGPTFFTFFRKFHFFFENFIKFILRGTPGGIFLTPELFEKYPYPASIGGGAGGTPAGVNL